MNEMLARQMVLLRRLLSDYRIGRVGLNSLIQRIEGVSAMLAIESWRDATFPIVLTLEQVNAFSITEGVDLTEADKLLIENSLNEFEELIIAFENQNS